MFSRLDPLFKTQLRLAENLDTRQGIRRREQDSGKNQQEEKRDRADNTDMWEDSTVVSVRALKTFLEQLVQTHAKPGSGERIEVPESSVTMTGTTRAPETETQTARAAQAYERTYRATHENEQPVPESASLPEIDLHPEEIRIIHRLIDDLRELDRRGVAHLTIRKSASFLQSLVNAVNEA